MIYGWGISCEICLKWMSLDHTDDKSILVHIMAWWCKATSHYLSQCWPKSKSPYGITRLIWVKHPYWMNHQVDKILGTHFHNLNHMHGSLQWRLNELGGHLKSPASRLFTQPFIQVQIKENMKAPRHWPLCGEFTGDRGIPCTKGQWCGKCFHLIVSSWLL